MVKKIIALTDWISAHDAADILSEKHNRPVSGKYIRSLSKRAKNPVRTQQMGNRLLYNKADIEACNIKERRLNEKPDIA